MRRFLLAVIPAIAVLFPVTGRTQNISVTPNPVPLDGSLTIRMSGVAPGAPVSLFWDKNQTAFAVPNIFENTYPYGDSNGNVNFTLDLFPFRVYPATAGNHVLTLSWIPPFGSGIPVDPTSLTATVRVPVTVLPRTGWPASPPLPTRASTGVNCCRRPRAWQPPLGFR